MNTPDKPYILLTGSANPKLADSIGKTLNQCVQVTTSRFADGEIRVEIPENVRNCDVFIIQPTCPPVNDNIMELALMADAAKRASAEKIAAIVPYYGYSRQDRKERSRVPISSAAVAQMLQAVGIQRILTMDIHSEQLQGSFSGPWDNIYGSYSLIPEIKERDIPLSSCFS